MADYIPIFYFPVEEERLFAIDKLETWSEACVFLPDDKDWHLSRMKYGIRTSDSRNWWHQHVLVTISHSLSIEVLDFVEQEVTRFKSKELTPIVQAIDEVIDNIINQNVSIDIEKDPWMDWLLDAEKVLQAFEQSQAQYDLESYLVNDAVDTFFSFLKSLKWAAEEAQELGWGLLYFRPR